MRNNRIINYAFLKYYNEFKSDEKRIDFDDKEDRIKLVLEIFNHSNLFVDNNRRVLFESFVSEYYDNNGLDSISFSKELYELFSFMVIQIGFKIRDSQCCDDELIKFIDDAVNICGDFYKVWNYEIYGRFEQAFNILGDIFNDKFPKFTDELIGNSFTDD